VLATRARLEDGRYTGELEFYCYGDGKAEAIRSLAVARGIELESSYAYSDSSTDLPMLRTVGHPVAVNPDKELRKEAETEGWDIRDFRRPVRLRTRIVQTAAHPRTRVAAGVVAASAAAAIVLWLVVRSRLSGRRTTAA
jgi:haloacid dehalogenase-like hydrolase